MHGTSKTARRVGALGEHAECDAVKVHSEVADGSQQLLIVRPRTDKGCGGDCEGGAALAGVHWLEQ